MARAANWCPLDEIGAYDLVANEGNAKEKRYTCFVQISDFSVGAVPEIKSLTINDATADATGVEFELNKEFKVGYIGREADGSSSRGITAAYKFLGGPVNDMTLVDYPNKSFSVSYWLRIKELPSAGAINLFGIEDRRGSWPSNNWGFFWSHLTNTGYVESYTKRGSGEYRYKYPETTVVTPGAWTHITHVFDYDNSNALLMKLYINGVYQAPVASGIDGTSSSNVVNGIPNRSGGRSTMSPGMWMHILGGRGDNPGYSEAIIDDVTVWSSAIDESDISKAMVGLDSNNLPSNVLCFWDFENAPASNGSYASKGAVTGAPFGSFELSSSGSQQIFFSSPSEAGCPYVKGSAFAVETKPTWSTRQAVISNASGSDTEGEATVVYKAYGDKTLSLNLKNSWGEDNKDYPLIAVVDDSAIDGVGADSSDMKVYTMDKTMFLEFAEGGAYEVSVYNMSGMLVGSDARSINAGEIMHINIGQAGVYVVSIVKDGKELRSIKVVNK